MHDMKFDIENLPDSPELLRKIIFDMQAEFASYKEKYARLLEEFCLDKKRLYSSSSEKNILQTDLFDEAGVELSDELKEQLDDEIEVSSHKRKKHPVRRALPQDLPRETIVHDISDEDKICECGNHLSKIGEEITEQLKYIPAQLSVIQHVRPKYACRPCQENVKIAPMPILFLPKCIATPELVSHTIIAKYYDHLPLYRQENIWHRLGIDLPRSSLCGWILKTAELCEPLIKLLQKIIIHYDYAQADETTVQVLDEVGRTNTTKSYMWCVRRRRTKMLSMDRQQIYARSYREDGGRPTEVGYQRLTSNYFKRLLLRATVVSIEGKAENKLCKYGSERRTTLNLC